LREYYHNKRTYKSILNVALDIHMIATGASDSYNGAGLEDYYFLHNVILNDWKPSGKNRAFDGLVKDLILTSIEEYEEFLRSVNHQHLIRKSYYEKQLTKEQ
jgi:hypothetical protein